MNILDLRDAPHHLPQLTAWHHQEWGHLNPHRSMAQLCTQMQEYLGDHAIPTMLVGVEGNTLLGSASLIHSDMDTHTELSPWLANVYVHAAHRGKGIGKQLVLAIMAHARQQGQETIYLFTEDQEGFYTSLGWTLWRRETYKGQHVSIMAMHPCRPQ